MGLLDGLKKLRKALRGKSAFEIERDRRLKLSNEYSERLRERQREAAEISAEHRAEDERIEQTRKVTEFYKYFRGGCAEVNDPDTAVLAGLPEPSPNGRIYENRPEDSGAKIDDITKKPPECQSSRGRGYVKIPAFPFMPYPKQRSMRLLTEEVPSTISIDSIAEMPRNRRYTEELRRKEAELSALSEFLDRRAALPPDPAALFSGNKYKGHPLYNVMEKVNDRTLPEAERLAAVMDVVEKDIIRIMTDSGHEYDKDNKGNISHIREISQSLLEDMDKKGVIFNIGELNANGSMSPEFTLYRAAISAAAKQGVDMGIRVNPLYEKIKSLDEKGSSSGIFGEISFRDLIVAAGVKLNGGMGPSANPFRDDPGADAIAKASSRLLFVEKATPGWILADTLAMAYEIYDLSGKWVDGLPYFMASGLPGYMKSRYPGYPAEFPLAAGREDALAAAYKDAGEIICYDCDKPIAPDSAVYAARRTYGGCNGAESFYCPECAEKFLEEMRSYEREGNVRIIFTSAGEPEPEREKML